MSAPPGGVPQLLYVDDEANNRELFDLHFADEFQVLTAASGPEALAIVERTSVGLVLTDERMPGMTGIELLAKLVEKFPNTVRRDGTCCGMADSTAVG